MNLPGFSAEASLYDASGHYYMTGHRDQADGALHPAQLGPSPCGACQLRCNFCDFRCNDPGCFRRCVGSCFRCCPFS